MHLRPCAHKSGSRESNAERTYEYFQNFILEILVRTAIRRTPPPWGDEKLARQRLVIPANFVARIVRPEAQSDFDSLESRTEGKRTTQQSR